MVHRNTQDERHHGRHSSGVRIREEVRRVYLGAPIIYYNSREIASGGDKNGGTMDGESVKMSLREMEEMVVGHSVEMVIINERYDEFGLMLDHALWVLFLEQVDPEARVWFSDIIGIEHLTGHKVK